MTVVAIAGVSGAVGKSVLEPFLADEGISGVVALADGELELQHTKLQVHPPDVSQSLLDQLDVSMVLQVAGPGSWSWRRSKRRAQLQLTEQLLNACRIPSVQMVTLLSSGLVYGFHRDNPIPLWEGSPLRPESAIPRWLHVVESLYSQFARAEQDKVMQIVRSAPVLCPGGGHPLEALSNRSTMYALKGHDPPLQFLDVRDMGGATCALMKSGSLGIFNLAADETVSLTDLAIMHRKRLVRLPEVILKLMLRIAWSVGWAPVRGLPPHLLGLLKYPLVLSNRKIKQETLYRFKFSSRGAVLDRMDQAEEVV